MSNETTNTTNITPQQLAFGEIISQIEPAVQSDARQPIQLAFEYVVDQVAVQDFILDYWMQPHNRRTRIQD